MKPGPKYKLSQTLFFMKDNKIYEAGVYTIRHEHGYLSSKAFKNKIEYEMNPYGWMDESVLFPSKEELIKSL